VKILLAGATGAIGRPLVARLVDAGHEVVALTRRPGKVAELDAAGARGVACDVCEREQLIAIAHETRPDVVVDETTDLPQRYDGRRMRGFYDGMTKLRLQGTPNLMDAAHETGARLVFQSVAFAYRPDGDPPAPGSEQRLRTEDDEVYGHEAPEPWNLAMPAIAALEQRVVGSGGLVLRYGYFYGPGTHFAPGGQFHEEVRKRRMPVPGRGTGVFSFIHVDDAAAATARAIETPEAAGILNLVDDDPIPLGEWVPLFADAIGAARPLRVPLFLAKLATGPLPLHFATTLPGTSNARAKQALGWQPAYPSVREGFRAAPTRLERTEYAK
jgi:nucleoside-diphosphate-sugar epimerase